MLILAKAVAFAAGSIATAYWQLFAPVAAIADTGLRTKPGQAQGWYSLGHAEPLSAPDGVQVVALLAKGVQRVRNAPTRMHTYIRVHHTCSMTSTPHLWPPTIWGFTYCDGAAALWSIRGSLRWSALAPEAANACPASRSHDLDMRNARYGPQVQASLCPQSARRVAHSSHSPSMHLPRGVACARSLRFLCM